ncbi:X-ray radiation resistance-associated protein 1 isoform X2 [Labrus bergylta]|uniref:X-ray radiation resistance associated 1 n=2 Tax=Labrus bergylta TaxID=56723 RepID=A0A3Q3E992_9LABR
MTFDAADFPHLEVLDLSYNNLSADSIVNIGRLPRLKVLHLTGNELHHLPPHLCSSNQSPAQLPAAREDSQFETLEVLMLDDNKLSSGVFNSLSNLKRLKYLNLQGNRISKIPYLQPAGSSKAAIEERTEEQGPAHTEPNPVTNEDLKRTSQTEHIKESCGGSTSPLPALQFLNLADNKIAEEDGVMAAALFPTLREIDICSNPLTMQRSGDPPLLTYYLQDRLGITIRRKKKQEAMKLPVKVSTDPKWKVEERTQKVLNKSSMRDAPCPAETQGERNEMHLEKTPESLQEETQHFFVTQATDFELDFQNNERETSENKVGHKAETDPEGLPCYEMLMDANSYPDAEEPIGIQTAVRMLEHTLKNLNVYRDSKPKLDSIQAPYREREKRIKKLPPLRPIKQPSEKVDEMIKEIKESTSIREVPLSSAVRNTSVTNQDYKEAQSLLRDMKTKYKMVHQKTMEQVASVEMERNTGQNGAAPPPVNSEL